MSDEPRPILSKKHVHAILSVVVPTLVADGMIIAASAVAFLGGELAVIAVLVVGFLLPFFVARLICRFAGVGNGQLWRAMAAGFFGGPLIAFFLAFFMSGWEAPFLPILLPAERGGQDAPA